MEETSLTPTSVEGISPSARKVDTLGRSNEKKRGKRPRAENIKLTRVPRSDGMPKPRDYWLNGCLSYLLRPNGQRWFYDFLHGYKKAHPASYGPAVVLAHRHLGKSTGGVIYLIERCLQKPSNVIFLAPRHNQCERILRQPLRKVLSNCPPEIRLNWRGPVLTIRNPMWGDPGAVSTFQYLGADKDDGSHIRGCGGQNVIFLDEVRDNACLENLVTGVLMWSFQKQEDPLLVMITTPPDSLDHPLTRPGGFLEVAEAEGRALTISGEKNPDVSPDDIQEILKACNNDRNSDYYRREFLCHLIQNSELATCKEYSAMKAVCEVEEYARPPNFYPMIVADMGWEPDPTAILAGYIDFDQQVLVVEDERLIKRASTGEFAAAVLDLEAKVFPGMTGIRRFADATPQQLDDFWREEKVQFASVEKYDRKAALARLRAIVAEGRLRILPRAKHLRYQLLTGLLDKRGELARSESLGHQDCTAALIYMARMAPWSRNTHPLALPGQSGDFIPPGVVPVRQEGHVKTAACRPGQIRHGQITVRRW